MKAICIWTGLLCLAASSALAQLPEPNFYKLDFVVKEVEGGKVVNSRAYSSMHAASGKDRSVVRTGSRVPQQTAREGGFQYQDVGINLDFALLREIPTERVSFELTVDITSTADSATAGIPPIYRTNQWKSAVVLSLRKPTIVFSSDDVASRRQFQIEVTATPIK